MKQNEVNQYSQNVVELKTPNGKKLILRIKPNDHSSYQVTQNLRDGLSAVESFEIVEKEKAQSED